MSEVAIVLEFQTQFFNKGPNADNACPDQFAPGRNSLIRIYTVWNSIDHSVKQ